MTFTRKLAAGITAVAAALAAATMSAAPAQADDATDAFISALDGAGLTGIDPAAAVAAGQAVCPLLSQPGQNIADAAANVSEAIGRPLGPATMFTGLAISIFCPRAVDALTDGVPFSFLR